MELVKQNKSVLLEAVCGAGKTELVYATISMMLSNGKKVGFAIPRRQVVLEIAERLQSVFTKIKVTPVCQGFTEDTKGDLIVCTTHQLYRYNNYFDLLIVDEPDAFPFKGNIVLQGIAKNSCKGVNVYLSATPDEFLLKQVRDGSLGYLYLPKRPTNRDMIVPTAYYLHKPFMIAYGIYRTLKLVRRKKQVIIFVPRIKQGRKLYFFLKFIFKCCCIDSKIEDKDTIIKDFKDKKYDVCISTTVLERGITIKSVNMIVLGASDKVFDEASLVQMAGRVGRSVTDPYGECLFLSTSRNENIDNCIKRIERANND